MNNHSYVLLQYMALCTKINFKFVQYNQYRNTALLPILSVISPRSYPYTMPATLYNPTTLSHIIHNTIIYYTPYNYISIMYISCCYHLSITCYIIKYIIAMCYIIIYYINTHITLYNT